MYGVVSMNEFAKYAATNYKLITRPFKTNNRATNKDLTMSEDRLNRIEKHLDKMSAAMVDMARMEERLVSAFRE